MGVDYGWFAFPSGCGCGRCGRPSVRRPAGSASCCWRCVCCPWPTGAGARGVHAPAGTTRSLPPVAPASFAGNFRVTGEDPGGGQTSGAVRALGAAFRYRTTASALNSGDHKRSPSPAPGGAGLRGAHHSGTRPDVLSLCSARITRHRRFCGTGSDAGSRCRPPRVWLCVRWWTRCGTGCTAWRQERVPANRSRSATSSAGEGDARFCRRSSAAAAS